MYISLSSLYFEILIRYSNAKLLNISETENMFHNIFTGCSITINLGDKRMSGATGRSRPRQVKFKVSPL